MNILQPEILECKLSSLNVDGICQLLNKIEDLDSSAVNKYKKVIKDNNVNGRVLLHCDLDELKNVIRIEFLIDCFSKIITF